MPTVQVFEVDDELGVELPADLVSSLGLTVGDDVVLTHTPHGIRLSFPQAAQREPLPTPTDPA